MDQGAYLSGDQTEDSAHDGGLKKVDQKRYLHDGNDAVRN